MKPAIEINTVQDFKDLVGADDFSVTYRITTGQRKGQFRKAARANVAEVKALVKGNGNEAAAETREDKGIVVYLDHDKQGIRSFCLGELIKLIVNGQEYNFV